MAGQRFWAHGAQISFDSIDVGGVTGISGPSQTSEEVEITDNDSGGVREFLRGMKDSGSLSLECRYIPGEDGQQALVDNLNAGASVDNTKEVVITMPSGATDDSTVATLTFDAYVQDAPIELPQTSNEAASRSFTLRISGDVTEAVA